MSDAFYIDIRDNTVDPLLVEFGTTYTVVTPGTFDKRTLRTSDPTTRSVIGLVSNGSFANDLLQGEGAVKQWTSQRVLLLSSAADVARNERIVVDGVEHSLENVEEIKPANVNVLYILDLER